MSASVNWTAWNSAIGLPNCRRSFAYWKARSYAPCARPTPMAATDIRPPSRTSRSSWTHCAPRPPPPGAPPPPRAPPQTARVAVPGPPPAELLHRRRDLVPLDAVRDDDVRDLVLAGDRGGRQGARAVVPCARGVH